MSDLKKLSEYISDLCADNGIAEIVCVFQTSEDKTVTMHIAGDGQPSNAYKIIKIFVEDLIENLQQSKVEAFQVNIT